MKQTVRLWSTSGVALFYLATLNPALAQIASDATLPQNSSVTTQGNVNSINGGTQAGSNLFHSFEEFSVSSGSIAYFNNTLDIQNIISRVTGSSVSNIDGTIEANGSANLFLLNPNGIIFGSKASLNIGGSFVATTANAIGFNNQGFFSASTPNQPQLLTVNPSALLFNQIAAGSITNNSKEPAGQILDPSVPSGVKDLFGLRVPDGRSLLLLGGNVSLANGGLNALGGRVELGGVAGSGTIGLNVDGSNLHLSFTDEVAPADVALTNGAEVNVAAGGGGSIAINAQNFNIARRSRLQAGINPGFGSIESQAGDIEINATGAINLTDDSAIENAVRPLAVGNGGDINIKTGTLSVKNRSQVGASTFGNGNAGNVTIKAGEAIFLNAEGSNDANNLSGVFSRVATEAVGNGGNIDITAESLWVNNGAVLSTTTFGKGNAGNVTIRASDTVSFDGVLNDTTNLSSTAVSRVATEAVGNGGNIDITAGSLSVASGGLLNVSTHGKGNAGRLTINTRDRVSFAGLGGNGQVSRALSLVWRRAEGNGGNINITTNSLWVSNGAVLSAGTFGNGDGGSITINTNTLEAVNGGQILTNSGKNSNAGNINLNVTDSITLAGSDPSFYNRVKPSDRGKLVFDRPISGVFASTSDTSTGLGGDLKITTRRLIVQDQAEVNVSSKSSATAGNLQIKAHSIQLNQGKLNAETTSGNGGNITLHLQDLLLMRHNSQITATAGTEHAEGDGGNITINAPFIVAFPSENSDINANADIGNGGRVHITAFGIFGTQFREKLSLNTSEITASSEFGVDGVVELNTPNIDLSSGLVTLPAELVNVEELITQGCTANVGLAASKFVVTGRGGLPPTPAEALRSESALVDLGSPVQAEENQASATSVTNISGETAPTQLVEAQGWVIGDNGEVVLTASALNFLPHNPWLMIADCHASKTSS